MGIADKRAAEKIKEKQKQDGEKKEKRSSKQIFHFSFFLTKLFIFRNIILQTITSSGKFYPLGQKFNVVYIQISDKVTKTICQSGKELVLIETTILVSLSVHMTLQVHSSTKRIFIEAYAYFHRILEWLS